jgi:hypothetical protein
MTDFEGRMNELLAQARTLEPPEGASGVVRRRLASTLAVTAVVSLALPTKAAPLLGAKLSTAVEAGLGLAPSATASALASTASTLLAPVALGLVLGLTAIAPSAPEEPTHSTPTFRASPRENTSRHAPRSRPVATVVPLEGEREVIGDEASRTAPAVASTKPDPGRAQARDPLRPQAELLEHARLVLRQGDPTLALRSIERYRREFPNGAFFEEAITLQASALCRLGRFAEGGALLNRLDASSQSPGLTRARELCEHL